MHRRSFIETVFGAVAVAAIAASPAVASPRCARCRDRREIITEVPVEGLCVRAEGAYIPDPALGVRYVLVPCPECT